MKAGNRLSCNQISKQIFFLRNLQYAWIMCLIITHSLCLKLIFFHMKNPFHMLKMQVRVRLENIVTSHLQIMLNLHDAIRFCSKYIMAAEHITHSIVLITKEIIYAFARNYSSVLKKIKIRFSTVIVVHHQIIKFYEINEFKLIDWTAET